MNTVDLFQLQANIFTFVVLFYKGEATPYSNSSTEVKVAG